MVINTITPAMDNGGGSRDLARKQSNRSAPVLTMLFELNSPQPVSNQQTGQPECNGSAGVHGNQLENTS